jgi:hypothetical protein
MAKRPRVRAPAPRPTTPIVPSVARGSGLVPVGTPALSPGQAMAILTARPSRTAGPAYNAPSPSWPGTAQPPAPPPLPSPVPPSNQGLLPTAGLLGQLPPRRVR